MLAALPEGVPKKKINDPVVLKQTREAWAAMSEEEKEAATKDKVGVMASERKAKGYGHHNTDVSAFHDVKTTIARVENEVSTLDMPCG